jgi:hypothetical protein
MEISGFVFWEKLFTFVVLFKLKISQNRNPLGHPPVFSGWGVQSQDNKGD